jgi:hypothetical protein
MSLFWTWAAWVTAGLLIGELVVRRDKRTTNNLSPGVYMILVALGPVTLIAAIGYRLVTGRWMGK